MTDTPENTPGLTTCWYVKDFADGWIKFYDHDRACDQAMQTGAIMQYSVTGKPPQPSERNREAEQQQPDTNKLLTEDELKFLWEYGKCGIRHNYYYDEDAKSRIEKLDSIISKLQSGQPNEIAKAQQRVKELETAIKRSIKDISKPDGLGLDRIVLNLQKSLQP